MITKKANSDEPNWYKQNKKLINKDIHLNIVNSAQMNCRKSHIGFNKTV